MTEPHSGSSQKSGLAMGNVLKREQDGKYHIVEDQVSIEEPLEIQVNGQPLAVTMRTPGQDEELALGFLLTEGLIRHQSDLQMEKTLQLESNRISLHLAENHPHTSTPLQRYGTIQASCGICGTTSIADILKRHSPLEVKPQPNLPESRLLELPETMRMAQAQFSNSGGLHASALFRAGGQLQCLREDIGRHNALDKVAGWAILQEAVPLEQSLLLVSGRTSFELVQKALALRIPVLAGISAPSSLAVNFARDCGITLIGFLRSNRFNVYTHPQRLNRE